MLKFDMLLPGILHIIIETFIYVPENRYHQNTMKISSYFILRSSLQDLNSSRIDSISLQLRVILPPFHIWGWYNSLFYRNQVSCAFIERLIQSYWKQEVKEYLIVLLHSSWYVPSLSCDIAWLCAVWKIVNFLLNSPDSQYSTFVFCKRWRKVL